MAKDPATLEDAAQAFLLVQDMASGILSGGDESVICPGCQGDYNHPVRFVLNLGGRIIDVTSAQLKVHRGEAAGRGAVICILYECECGWLWKETRHFHKGNTHTQSTLLRRLEDGDFTSTLWRD